MLALLAGLGLLAGGAYWYTHKKSDSNNSESKILGVWYSVTPSPGLMMTFTADHIVKLKSTAVGLPVPEIPGKWSIDSDGKLHTNGGVEGKDNVADAFTITDSTLSITSGGKTITFARVQPSNSGPAPRPIPRPIPNSNNGGLPKIFNGLEVGDKVIIDMNNGGIFGPPITAQSAVGTVTKISSDGTFDANILGYFENGQYKNFAVPIKDTRIPQSSINQKAPAVHGEGWHPHNHGARYIVDGNTSRGEDDRFDFG